ncbi:MAG: D-alanine--D-alanine ligase family protein [Bowdeniella nasicola]|nr:D-alanine--D-alanine ligase family protein [Bowdeniella nasicola]
MNTTRTRPRVALLIGGRSTEHSISCLTAAGVLTHLDRDRYDVIVLGITRSGAWVHLPDDATPLEGGRAEVDPQAPAAALVQTADGCVHAWSGGRDRGRVDVVFPLLHGPFGEDGTVQGMLEMLGVHYVGAGVFASAAGMDKQFTKVVLAGAGLPVGPYVAATAQRFERESDAVLAECARLRPPLFVKPARAGSSMGITRVTDLAQLEDAIREAQRHDPKVIIEQGIEGREIEVAVLQGRDGKARVAPIGELIMDLPSDGFYDYETKYFAHDAVTMACPAELTAEQEHTIRDLAIRTFEALECEGLARVDFFLPSDGNPVINEINTMPGMTPYSMFPYLWAAGGLHYTELVSELIELALQREQGLR